MHLTPAVVTFLAVLSLLSTSFALDQPDINVVRVPLQRKSFVTKSPNRNSRSRANTAAGRVNLGFLKTNVANIAMKYRVTLAAYESNTGFPHPLAQAISAINTGSLAAGRNDSGAGTTLPTGKVVKRRRDRTFGPLGNRTSPNHVPRGYHIKREDISLSDINSNMWMGAISVGTPPQNFTVDFDTGSADLILPDKACDNTCDGHARYDPTASSTFVNLGKTFQMTYSGGSSVNGTQYADNVYMGGYEAVNQTFGAATTYSTGLQSPTFLPDGLLGLGFSLISTSGTPSACSAFALSSESGKSELTIGGTNTNLYQASTIEYINVSIPAYWQIPFAGLFRPGLNNTPDVVLVNKTSYAQAIVDSGTTLIITTDDLAQAFYANVTNAAEIGGGVWTVPCDTVGSLAPTLTLGSRSFTVSSSTFNLGPVSEGSSDCVAGLAGGGSPYWIIGDVFLQNVYTIFDVANTRIGFANLA
ncbi:aspartic peptidase domain-containing protein [Chiua virens]|nr:aspartic peptidase domain-containing protein [Chiua virens]